MEVLVPIIIIALLILLNALFVAAEFAIVVAPMTRIAQRADAGSGVARRILAILRDTNRQYRYLATAQIGITIASLGLGMYGEHIVADWLYAWFSRFTPLAEPLAHSAAFVLAVGLLTYLHVVLGEMVPKSLALQFSEVTVLQVANPMAAMQRILSPLVFLLNGAGNWITRLLGVPPVDGQARLFTADELEFIVEESREGGLILSWEQLIIENILDLRERTVGQVMTPRTRMVAIPVDQVEAHVMALVCRSHQSRFPVYEDNLDQIVGLLHVKDLARHRIQSAGTFDLRRLAQQHTVEFVPESLSLERMLIRFRTTQTQLAVVIDEFGGTAGIITLEDLVEEVVGEIQDEFDQEAAPVEEIGPGELRVQGNLLLAELNQHYDLGLESPEVDTVGGLFMALLGRIPEPGDTITSHGVTFRVESLDGMAVDQALVFLPASGDQGEPSPMVGEG